MEKGPVPGGNKVITRPDGLQIIDDVQDIIPAIPFPAIDVFVSYIKKQA